MRPLLRSSWPGVYTVFEGGDGGGVLIKNGRAAEIDELLWRCGHLPFVCNTFRLGDCFLRVAGESFGAVLAPERAGYAASAFKRTGERVAP